MREAGNALRAAPRLLKGMKCMIHSQNQIFLRGFAAEPPRFSHESHGVSYDTFPLSVPRLSGAADVLNVLAPRPLLEPLALAEGELVELTGEVRSFNNRSGQGSRLVISVLARTLARSEGEPANELTLSGALCKAPHHRRTPLGRDICDLLLAVNRRYGRADYLPCITWGSLAVACGELDVGARLNLEGRLQSRLYHKEIDGEKVPRTAYEVSVMTMTVQEDQPAE